MSSVLPDARANKNLEGPGVRARVQKFGGYLAGMIMPNMGAFIAWGLITALFIEKGWAPNATLAALVAPTLYFLLPILIGYTGGRMVHGQRGAVSGAIATLGVIMGGITSVADWEGTPMFLGAMIMGPAAAYLQKLFDKSVEGKVPSGFEMLIDNFSVGIIGGAMAIVGRLGVGPVVEALVQLMSGGVQALVDARLLPLLSIFIEPAKVLFLNNAINHGILSPLGIAQAQETGRSILFMVESNPGAGLGLLLAYAFFGPKALRPSTPGAIIIHFFGGIHEIFFPYVLMKPILILGTIAGSMSGLFIGSALGAGLVAPASPGSILAYLAVTPRDGYVPMLATVITAALVSFAVCSALMGFGRGARDDEVVAPEDTVLDPDVERRVVHVADNAAEPTHAESVAGSGIPHRHGGGVASAGSAAAATVAGTPPAEGGASGVKGGDVKKVIIACDAGMGSSVMVASVMKKKLSPYGVEVTHTPVDQIPADAQVVLTQEGLADRARKQAPQAVVVPFKAYMGDPAFTNVENAIKNGETIE